jgi:hypothetical protein
MNNLVSLVKLGAATALVTGTSLCLYLVLTDQCDPDYSPPINLIAFNVGFGIAAAGGAALLGSLLWGRLKVRSRLSL